MSGLDIFAMLVIILLIAVVIWLVVLLGSLPGNIARKRNHPQADAISALGWIGIITLGLSWFVAIAWAYYKPTPASGSNEALEARVEDLENQLQQMKAGGGES
jgi:amino acid transporter